MVEIMTPGEWGTRDGKPAIVWHRPGVAASGESSVVQEVRTYANEVERFEARQRGLDRSSKDSGSSRRRGNQQQGRNPRLVYLSDAAQDDSVLRSFADVVAPDSDVAVYAKNSVLRLKDGVTPPVQPERHTLADGREAWVSRFPALQATKRPFTMIVAEADSAVERSVEEIRPRG